MRYVCLWSPSWPTGAAFPADLVAALLQHAPRVRVGDGQRAREGVLVFAMADRTEFLHRVRSARPTASQKSWMRLIRGALERITLPDAVTGVALRMESVIGNDGVQGDLFDKRFASAPQVERTVSLLMDDQGDVVLTPHNSRIRWWTRARSGRGRIPRWRQRAERAAWPGHSAERSPRRVSPCSSRRRRGSCPCARRSAATTRCRCSIATAIRRTRSWTWRVRSAGGVGSGRFRTGASISGA